MEVARDASPRVDQVSLPHSDALTFPRLAGKHTSRVELHRRLDRLAPVTIVEALPGFGKTTVVATWAREQEHAGTKVVWLRASSSLDDPAVFLTTLYDGLFCAGASASDDEPTTPGTEVTAVTSASPEQPVILIIDDIHRITDPRVLDIPARLAARSPGFHVVGCGVAAHHLCAAAAHHELETNILRGSDFIVSVDQLPAVAATWGHDLSMDRAKVLHRLVGGWMLPLRLVLDATPRWTTHFATHVARDFLVDTVIPQVMDLMDPDTLAVAMRLAIPRRLTEAVAAAVLAAGSSDDLTADRARIIHELERCGLLWREPRHDEHVEWRFPRLVRRTLAARLHQQAPDEAQLIHRTAARTLRTSGCAEMTGLALRHARLGADWTMLADIWSQDAWELTAVALEDFEFAYVGIPETARSTHPVLTFPAALAQALAEAPNSDGSAEALMRHYAQAGEEYLKQCPEVPPTSKSIDALTAGLVALRMGGRLKDAQQLAARVEREIDRAQDSSPTQNGRTAWFRLQSGLTQLLAGHYGAALEQLRAGYDISRSATTGAEAAALLAMGHSMSGAKDDALRWLAAHELIDVSGTWTEHTATLPTRLARAMLAMDRLDAESTAVELAGLGRGADASELWSLIMAVSTRQALLFGDPAAMIAQLDHVARIRARHLNTPDGIARWLFDRCTAELRLALGEVNRAMAMLGDGLAQPPWLRTPTARLHLLTGDYALARDIAATGARATGMHLRDRAELLMIETAAHLGMGSHADAVEAFSRAHALCDDSGNLEPYLLLAPDDRAHLMRITASTLSGDEHGRLDACGRVYPERVELIELTPREAEVLRQMPQHESLAGIARTLSVSVNTVKKQRLSLYTKLDARDRSTALLRAERLGLI